MSLARFHMAGLGLGLVFTAFLSRAEVSVVVEHNPNEAARRAFAFKTVPAPSGNDAATSARFALAYGDPDGNSAELDVLRDGRGPTEEDQPQANFFFADGSPGGGLLIDLGSVLELKQIVTYSWHPNTRGPQVYKLYASDGQSDSFRTKLDAQADPTKSGWRPIANVDTRPKNGEPGGQYGVAISDPSGSLGKYRFVLLACSSTETSDSFGNTFFSEIDILSSTPLPAGTSNAPAEKIEAVDIISLPEGYEITLDTSDTPDLTAWARAKLIPMAKEWYPKIVQMLPSQDYAAPKKCSIVFSEEMRGVAATSGTRVRCAAQWFRRNLEGEAVGAVFHELVHVVQQYGRARRANPDATRPPGWLTEGIPDYLRWFIYEPQTKGAEITRRNISRARYDASYRISANFLNWVSEKYSRDLVKNLNAALREGKYREDLWKENTGQTLSELGEAWKKEMESKVAAEPGGA